MKTNFGDTEADREGNQRAQYADAFPFPRADSFGNCNNFASAFFMHDDESSCLQMAKLTAPGAPPSLGGKAPPSQDCETLLNAEYYTSKMGIFPGIGGFLADLNSIESIDVWTYDPATQVYTKAASSASLAAKAAKTGDTCSCENALKEVEYNIVLQYDKDKKQYSINSKSKDSKITARVVVYKGKKEAKCDSYLGVQQKFKINFQTKAGVVQRRSGNPGYMDGFPILIGTKEAGEPIDSYVDGF